MLGERELAQGELLLDVQNLSTHFNTEEGIVRAVDRVSFQVYKGQNPELSGRAAAEKALLPSPLCRSSPSPTAGLSRARYSTIGKTALLILLPFTTKAKRCGSLGG